MRKARTMPNRILREGILSSPRVDKLDEAAEVFYRRLHSVVDDYGRYHADACLLLAACYPLRVKKIALTKIQKMLQQIIEEKLAKLHRTKKGDVVELIDFRQPIRTHKSKFPLDGEEK
jgi:hypothetical protein